MSVFDVVAALTTMAALFAWVNHRYVGLPTTIGLMIISLAMSVGLVALGHAGVEAVDTFTQFIGVIDFDAAVLHGMLGALLFAGALHLDLDDLARQKGAIAVTGTRGRAALAAASLSHSGPGRM